MDIASQRDFHEGAEGHTAGVRALALSPDGALIVSGAADKTIRCWRTETAELLWRFQWDAISQSEICFSQDGRFVISGFWGGGGIVVLDATNGVKVDEIAQGCLSVSASPQGLLVASNFSGFQIRELSKLRIVRRMVPTRRPTSCVRFDPNGVLIASGDSDSLRVWTRDGEEVWSKRLGHVQKVAFSTDGSMLAACFTTRPKSTPLDRNQRDDRKYGVRVFRSQDGVEAASFSGHKDEVTGIAFMRFDDLVVTTSQDRTMRVWESASGREVSALTALDSLTSLAADSFRGTLITGEASARIAKWQIGTPIRVRAEPRGNWAASFSEEGSLIGAALNERVFLWDADNLKRRQVLSGHSQTVVALAFV